MLSRTSLARAAFVAALSLTMPGLATTTADAKSGPAPTIAKAPVKVSMVFPVIGGASFTDTFLQCRSGCARQHLGQDLMAPRMRPLVATFNGYVSYVQKETTVGEGNLISVTGDNGWTVNYIHINNDSPGTDDGKGTELRSVMPGLVRGSRVFAGQQIGWTGDSGNAENAGPHTHFELRRGDAWSGTVYNAYPSLLAARNLPAPVPSGPHPDGSLVKLPSGPTIWQLRDGLRYVVPPSVLVTNRLDPARAISITRDELYYYRSGGTAGLMDGLVVRAPDLTVWVVVDGERILVPAETELVTLGTTAERIFLADAVAIAATPIALDQTLPGIVRSGALLRDLSTGQVWYVDEDGEKRAVPDAQTRTSWQWTEADITGVAPEALVDVPEGAPMTLRDGTVFVNTDRSWYVVSNGERRLLPGGLARVAYGWAKLPRMNANSAITARQPVGPALP